MVAELCTYRKRMQENPHKSFLCVPKGKNIAKKKGTMMNQVVIKLTVLLVKPIKRVRKSIIC